MINLNKYFHRGEGNILLTVDSVSRKYAYDTDRYDYNYTRYFPKHPTLAGDLTLLYTRRRDK